MMPMRVLVPIIAILLFCEIATAQTSISTGCPAVSITGPAGITQPGDTLTFSANIQVEDWNTLKFQWTVSAGVITRGQGTPHIQVETTREMNNTSVTATVEVEGLPAGCSGSVSETAAVAGCGLPVTLDEWGKLPTHDEKARIDFAGMQMGKYPNYHLLFLIGLNPKETRRSAALRVEKIKQQLITKAGISQNKIQFMYYPKDISYTRIYIVPKEAIEPLSQGYEATKDLNNIRPVRGAVPKPTRPLNTPSRNSGYQY